MKLMIAIFSFYLTAVALMPAVTENHCDHHVTESATEEMPMEHGAQPCAPGCLCQCLSNSVILPKEILSRLAQSEPRKEKTLAHYQSEKSNLFPATIWQPPQVA